MRVFHTSWWFFSEDWVTANLLNSSRTLLSIQADLNNAIVWMVSSHLLISKSSSPGTNPLMIAPKTPITIYINITFRFHSFFNSLARSSYLSFRFLSVLPCDQPEWKSPLFGSFSCFCWLSLDLVTWPRLDDPFVSQNPWEVCASHLLRRILDFVHILYFVCSVIFQFLVQSPVDYLAHQLLSSVMNLDPGDSQIHIWLINIDSLSCSLSLSLSLSLFPLQTSRSRWEV